MVYGFMKKYMCLSRKNCLLLLCISIFSLVGCSNEKETKSAFTPITEVDFDASMGKGTSEFSSALSNVDDVKRYSILKSLYQKNLPSKVVAGDQPKIPRIIHQIWLGPKNPPSYFATFREKWRDLHPDWEYRLWTDSDLDTLSLDLRDLIDATSNYAEKSDILRSELLEQFGGLYIDADMECHHCLDELHRKYDFYAGAEYPHQIATTPNRVWVGISIMASIPHHPILKSWKEHMRNSWEKVNATYTSPIERVINHTFFNFSKAVFENYQKDNLVNIVLPATYFYPLSAHNASKRRSNVRGLREKFYDFLEKVNLRSPRPFSQVYPESLAAHYWGNTWLPSSDDQLKDLQQQLDFLRKQFATFQKRFSNLEKIAIDKSDVEQGKHSLATNNAEIPGKLIAQ